MIRIPVVDIYVTGACNLDCQYCFGEIDTKPGMPRETFKRALDFAHLVKATAVEFCGGEPLMYRDLAWSVENARVEGFELILRTNGLLMSKWRNLVSENFRVVGISLDGDSETNDKMRPLKSRNGMSAEMKFQAPLQEVHALKSLNPTLRIILASVATAENATGILALGRILLQDMPPVDLWKIYQFVANNFRSIDNQKRFALSAEAAEILKRDVQSLVAGRFAVSFRMCDETDGSCLVINRDGDVLLGARRFGNIQRDAALDICSRLKAVGADKAITRNKTATYHTVTS